MLVIPINLWDFCILHHSSIQSNDYQVTTAYKIMAYLVLVLEVLQLLLLNAKIYLHLINAVEGLEGLVQDKLLWIYSNLVIIILYA